MATLEEFVASMRAALPGVCEDDEVGKMLEVFDQKGASFDLVEDGGIDSLDMVDLIFRVEGDLGVKVRLEKMVQEEVDLTVQNFYNSIRKDAVSPA